MGVGNMSELSTKKKRIRLASVMIAHFGTIRGLSVVRYEIVFGSGIIPKSVYQRYHNPVRSVGVRDIISCSRKAPVGMAEDRVDA